MNTDNKLYKVARKKITLYKYSIYTTALKRIYTENDLDTGTLYELINSHNSIYTNRIWILYLLINYQKFSPN